MFVIKTSQVRQDSPAPMHSTEELAAALAVRRQTILNWIKQGRISCIRVGKCYRITDVVFREVIQKGIV